VGDDKGVSVMDPGSKQLHSWSAPGISTGDMASMTASKDGFVWLGRDKKDGLGGRLYKSLNERIPVIGVAKSAFKDTPEELRLYRGRSSRPLFITSAGIDAGEAKSLIAIMYGQNRIPFILKRADQLSRSFPDC
jgi:deoxyribonuclease V